MVAPSGGEPIASGSHGEDMEHKYEAMNRALDAGNNFEDIVNNDLEDDMASIPDSVDNMIDMIMAVFKNHVSEIYSPPRVTALAKQYGLKEGFALDLSVCDEDGNPWDFDVPEMRERAKALVREMKPSLLIGSPMCTAFSVLQFLNRERLGEKEWK